MTATVMRCYRNSNGIAPRKTGGVQRSLFALYDYLIIVGPSVRIADVVSIYVAAIHCRDESISNLGPAGLDGQGADGWRRIADDNRTAANSRARDLPVVRNHFGGHVIPAAQAFRMKRGRDLFGSQLVV